MNVMRHTYLSNGDDGFALVYGNQDDFIALDWIGDWNEDPGNGWDVCGIEDGTKDHTLVRNLVFLMVAIGQHHPMKIHGWQI